MKPTLSHFLAPLCVILLVGLGVAAQSALEPRVGVLELNQTAQAQTLSPLITLASLHTLEACSKGMATCNPIFSTSTALAINTPTPRATTTTVMLATASPYPPLQTPEAWCLAIVNGNPLNLRDSANGRIVGQVAYNTVVAFDETTKTTKGGLVWVMLRDPARYNGLWVALSLLRGVRC